MITQPTEGLSRFRSRPPNRRVFLKLSGGWAAAVHSSRPAAGPPGSSLSERALTLCMGGDLMTGRGIDQILPHPEDPRLYESYMKSATGYVELAEAAGGPISRPVSFDYVWGDALEEMEWRNPDLRIVNLETAVTTSNSEWRGKGIHYRMHPRNLPCLTAGGIDCCGLANNHVLDWGYQGLEETLDSLRAAGIRSPGAGRNLSSASAPAVFDVQGKGRVVVFAFGVGSSGIPGDWAATGQRPGVNLLRDLSAQTAAEIGRQAAAVRRTGDLLVASIHWGGNWGYQVPEEHRQFARSLIDSAGFQVVHGHSTHHPIAIGVHQGAPILFGCGDLLNDYEGISGHERYRSELTLLYFITFDPADHRLQSIDLVPFRIRRFRLERASAGDAAWLADMLIREGRPWGTRSKVRSDGALGLEW